VQISLPVTQNYLHNFKKILYHFISKQQQF
jgi:hypothetical protein